MGAEERGPVTVSKEVYEGLKALHRSGITSNMMDRPCVVELCRRWGYLATAT